MKKTILITGASTGIGRDTALYFAQKGWNVAATMRNPGKAEGITENENLKIFALDVQDKNTIQKGVDQTISAFGQIDVLLNNAGYGAAGVLEAGTDEQIRRQFDVNFFGLIDVTKAVLPYMKKQKQGVVINISSVGGLMTIPLFSLYNASKFAVEGLSEGLFYELAPFGIKVKLIEPGGVATDFSGRSLDMWDASKMPEYQGFIDKVVSVMTNPKRQAGYATATEAAEVIYKAATDESNTLRYLVGKDAKQFWMIRRWLGYKTQMRLLKNYMGI